jgi:hypothetical protein
VSRRRFISTDISTDTKVNKLAQHAGDFAALLYTWLIPHAADDARLPGDPEKLLLVVVPGRRDKTAEDVAAALQAMVDVGLIEWDGETVNLPPTAFYKYQTYIPDGKRRGAHNTEDEREKEPNSAHQRKSAQNPAYPSHSPSPSPSPSSSTDDRRMRKSGRRNGAIRDLTGFEEWYAVYPRHKARPDAESAWAKLSPDERAAALSAIREQLTWPVFAATPPDKIPYPATWLNARRWTDEPDKPSPLLNGMHGTEEENLRRGGYHIRAADQLRAQGHDL